MKINAFVASRLGSVRVPFKNLRLLNGRPMFEYLVDTCLGVRSFSQLYINSDSQMLLDIAEQRYGDALKYYKRSEELGTSAATLDEYVIDFMEQEPGDVTVFLNPCSIFLKEQTIANALNYFIENNLDACVASEIIQTHCFFENSPINFSFSEKQPKSQDLTPVHAMTSGFFIWRNKTFLKNYKGNGFANFSGKFSSYGVSKMEAIDIDTEEEFQLAERFMTQTSGVSAPSYHPAIHDDVLSGKIKVN